MSLIALTREISASLNDCELSFHARQAIDIDKAAAQHRAYQHCLAELGARVISLPPEPALPDAVFVEDAAVVLDELAVITRPGAASRRAETRSIAEALSPYRPLHILTEPATLDGGDVMQIGRTIFVGRSQRTNSAGIEQLRDAVQPHGYEVEAIEMRGCLHLKSACSFIGRKTVLANRAFVAPDPLRSFELLDVSEEEPDAANALLLKDVVILPSSFPRTRALVEGRGFNVRALDVSELQKAEAGVTCCSLIFNE
jgi:dimethylargininase